MQITCPHCTTSYRIADAAVGANGRSVRCTRCQNVWRVDLDGSPAEGSVFAEEKAFGAELGAVEPSPPLAPAEEPEPAQQTDAQPEPAGPSLDELIGALAPGPERPAPETAPAPEPEPAAEAAPLALSDIPIPGSSAPALQPYDHDAAPDFAAIDNGPGDIESVAARRSRAAKRRSNLRIPLPVAIVAMLALCAGLIGLRREVVRHVPQLGSLYASIGLPVNLRGLDFAAVKIGSEIHDGVPVMVVEGSIVNTVAKPVEVPRLRFALLNASGAELYSWTAQPPQPVLEPGQRLPFRSRLASPPAEGHDVQVRFFTHRDAIAGLR